MGKHRKSIKRLIKKLSPEQCEVVARYHRRKPYDELGKYILCRRFALDNHIREVCSELEELESEADRGGSG